MFDPKDLALYPDEPGVYLMKDAGGKILYIGKAKSLRQRLRQYFNRTADEREMVPYLIAQVAAIDTLVALTERDALLLENNLIKRHKPKYNVLLKDGKTFISLVMTSHKWPMLRLTRTKRERGAYFGPYTNALAARQTHDLIQKLFPLRQCSDAELAQRKRPCLLYDMKRCLAPCMNLCTEDEYQRNVRGASRLLRGQDKDLLRELKGAMEQASERLEFERAADLLRTIQHIEHVSSVQHVERPLAKDCDAIGCEGIRGDLLIALLQFREGKVIGSEHFTFHGIASDEEETLASFLLQHYRPGLPCPAEILLPVSLGNRETLEALLSETHGRRIDLASPQRGEKADLVEMARRNAKALFLREQDERSLLEKRLIDLQETLKLARFPRRIECFDTSHIGGTDPVASLVSYVHGIRDKGRTKLFRIKESASSEDYRSMREVLLRHFSKQKETGDFCDLVILDGGKGQLNLGLEVFEELGIASVDLIALAKEGARHDKGLTKERIFVPHQKDPIAIDRISPLLFLLQRIRDEAHRIAIEYHRKRRSKRTLHSEIEEIPGIGPVKRQRLLSYYGSVRALKAATEESLEAVEGLSKRDIEEIRKFMGGGGSP